MAGEQWIVYGVSRMTTDPRNEHRPYRLPLARYFGWAQDKLSSDGTFMAARPSFFRYLGFRRGQRVARRWSKYATMAREKDPPPSGYGLEEWEKVHGTA